jgi:hypothetical protein
MVATQGREGPTAQNAVATHQAAGRGTPRANLRLARGPSAAPRSLCLSRGLDPPSRASLRLARGTRTPERVFASLEAALDPRHRTCSPDRSIKCSGMSRAPGSKVNPRLAGPPTPPGNHIPAVFDQPALCVHPRRCAGVVREGRCHSMTPWRPLPYLLHVAPRKGMTTPSKEVRSSTPRPPGATP